MNTTIFTILSVSFIMNAVAILFVICAVILILAILIQKGKGGGLSGAISGGAMGDVLGAKTKSKMTWITIFLVGIFLTLAVIMGKYYKTTVSEAGSEQPMSQQRMPVQPELPESPMLPLDVDELDSEVSEQDQETDLPSN